MTKNTLISFLVFLLSATGTNHLPAQTIRSGTHTRIEGTVTGRPDSKILYLLKDEQDFRVTKPIAIPIRNGKFEYDLTDTENQVYELIFKEEIEHGSWTPIPFFSENTTLRFELYPYDENEKNNVSGGPLTKGLHKWIVLENKIFQPLYEKQDSLLQANKTEEADLLNKEIARLDIELEQQKLEEIKEKHTLFNYYWLKRIMLQSALSKDQMSTAEQLELFHQYQSKYPDHPITLFLEKKINAVALTAGTDSLKNFLDFTAPDLSGNKQTLSNLIKDKVAVLDLWASWCGSCRRHSISLIPIYEAFKDKGFTIVGVAREYKDTRNMEEAIRADKYSWTQLCEIDDALGIWELYGVSNAGGARFLIDQTGKIILKNPTAEQVQAFLEQSL